LSESNERLLVRDDSLNCSSEVDFPDFLISENVPVDLRKSPTSDSILERTDLDRFSARPEWATRVSTSSGSTYLFFVELVLAEAEPNQFFGTSLLSWVLVWPNVFL
jgi:hypothetical protein